MAGEVGSVVGMTRTAIEGNDRRTDLGSDMRFQNVNLGSWWRQNLVDDLFTTLKRRRVSGGFRRMS